MVVLLKSRWGWSLVCASVVWGMMAWSLPAARVVSAVQQQPNREALDLYSFDYRTSPIKMKTVRNLNKPDWLEKLEIHVENTSTKPIYFIGMHITFPELVLPAQAAATPDPRIPVSERKYGFSFGYGDKRLLYFDERATADDKPVFPDTVEKILLPRKEIEGLKNALKYFNMADSQLTKIEISFTAISFGDGTGLLLHRKPTAPSD